MIRSGSAARNLLIVLLLCCGACRSEPELPVLGSAPRFSMTDVDGRQFSSDSLRGSPWVLSFFFASCQGPCPVINTNLSALAREFASKPLTLVSISVDPERDTPEALVKYSARFGADKQRWKFLTGSKEDVQRMSAELQVAAAAEPDLHSTRVFLVDDEMKVRGMFRGTERQGMEQLAGAVQQLLQRNR